MRFSGPHVAAWWAETGTAGASEGCNKPFWLRDEAIAYVQKHGGYIKPLFETPMVMGSPSAANWKYIALENERAVLHWIAKFDALQASASKDPA